MDIPRISVICTAYNQEDFIWECLESFINQDYPNKELIVTDNFSSDQTLEQIRKFEHENPTIRVIANSENLGLPRAFNRAAKLSNGELLIDLSGDDVLAKGALERISNCFSNLDDEYGVLYSNAVIIDKKGKELGRHFSDSGTEKPQGMIFGELLERYFILAPTMVFTRKVFEQLGGYDETLVYEDFDFWVRSSREFHYAYLPEVTIYHREHGSSFSNRTRELVFEESTFKVCQKALKLVRTRKEEKALQKRIDYHIRQCWLGEGKPLVPKYRRLRKKIPSSLVSDLGIGLINMFPGLFKRLYFFLKSDSSISPR